MQGMKCRGHSPELPLSAQEKSTSSCKVLANEEWTAARRRRRSREENRSRARPGRMQSGTWTRAASQEVLHDETPRPLRWVQPQLQENCVRNNDESLERAAPPRATRYYLATQRREVTTVLLGPKMRWDSCKLSSRTVSITLFPDTFSVSQALSCSFPVLVFSVCCGSV